MTIKIGSKVTAYGKKWIVNNVTDSSTVGSELPEVGQRMKELKLTLLVLEAESATTVDLGIMRIYGEHKMTTAFMDEKGDFHDPDRIMSEISQSLKGKN